MAEIQKDTMTATDVKKTDADKGTPKPETHQTTNPEFAPNVPATSSGEMSNGGQKTQGASVIPGTAAKHAVPTISKGAQGDNGDSERLSIRQDREQENAAQRAKWQEENVAEPVKAVADQKGKF